MKQAMTKAILELNNTAPAAGFFSCLMIDNFGFIIKDNKKNNLRRSKTDCDFKLGHVIVLLYILEV